MKNVVEFDAMEKFHVHEARDCESIKEALNNINEASHYGVDYREALAKAREILERCKTELGCE